jgi:hypothetical protein
MENSISANIWFHSKEMEVLEKMEKLRVPIDPAWKSTHQAAAIRKYIQLCVKKVFPGMGLANFAASIAERYAPLFQPTDYPCDLSKYDDLPDLQEASEAVHKELGKLESTAKRYVLLAFYVEKIVSFFVQSEHVAEYFFKCL